MVESLRLMFKLVVYWSIGIVIFLGGTFYGRWLENNCWKIALQDVSQEYEQLLLLERIIKLESGGKHEEVWGADGERGILQFKKSTFEFLKDRANMPNLNWESALDQIILANWSIRNGYAHYWSVYERAKEK